MHSYWFRRVDKYCMIGLFSIKSMNKNTYVNTYSVYKDLYLYGKHWSKSLRKTANSVKILQRPTTPAASTRHTRINRTQEKSVIFAAPKRSPFPVFLFSFKCIAFLSTHIFLIPHLFHYQNLIITDGSSPGFLIFLPALGDNAAPEQSMWDKKNYEKPVEAQQWNSHTILIDDESHVIPGSSLLPVIIAFNWQTHSVFQVRSKDIFTNTIKKPRERMDGENGCTGRWEKGMSSEETKVNVICFFIERKMS